MGNENTSSLLSRWGIFGIVMTLALLIALPIAGSNLMENVDAHEIMVVQSPVSGELSCYTDSGVKWQGFGRVTKYPRRAEYDFGTASNASSAEDDANSKKIRFNDGGHANLYGAVNWEMPLDCTSIIEIHKTFGSEEGITQQGVAKMIDLAVYLSGPLMSSTESSGERRAELTQLINDQAQNGVYQTTTRQAEVPDPITGEKKSTVIVEVARDAAGLPKRQQGSILGQFKISLLPISIKEIRYDKVVEDQIQARQKSTTQVQIAQADARRAEQEAITTAKQGEANAAKAKWEQETVNAKEIAQAEKALRVQQLAAQTAELYKKEQILRGEGEGEYKRLIIQGDNALAQKLEAYTQVQGVWADAFAKYQGNVVPTTVFGGSGGSSGTSANGAQMFMDIVTAKTARDLSLDLSTAKK